MSINLGTPIKTKQTPKLYAITPEIAGQLLRNTDANPRTATPACVHKYAQDMSKGFWTEGGSDMIVIDENDSVINGQNRLRAVAESKTTQNFWVLYGVKPDYCDNTDSGQSRKLKHYVEAKLNKSCTCCDIIAAILPRFYALHEGSGCLTHLLNSRDSRNSSVTRQQAMSMLETNLTDILMYAESAQLVSNLQFDHKHRANLGIAFMLIDQLGRGDHLREFIEQMKAYTTNHIAVGVLREKLQASQENAEKNREKNCKCHRDYVIYATLNAYDLFCKGDENNKYGRDIRKQMQNVGGTADEWGQLLRSHVAKKNPTVFAYEQS